jgi:hypothetical protein
MLKRGAVCSVAVLVVGIGALSWLRGKEAISAAAMQYGVQAVISGSLAIFGIFWVLRAAKNASNTNGK